MPPAVENTCAFGLGLPARSQLICSLYFQGSFNWTLFFGRKKTMQSVWLIFQIFQGFPSLKKHLFGLVSFIMTPSLNFLRVPGILRAARSLFLSMRHCSVEDFAAWPCTKRDCIDERSERNKKHVMIFCEKKVPCIKLSAKAPEYRPKSKTHRIHVWYIYLHLLILMVKCR